MTAVLAASLLEGEVGGKPEKPESLLCSKSYIKLGRGQLLSCRIFTTVSAFTMVELQVVQLQGMMSWTLLMSSSDMLSSILMQCFDDSLQ